MCPDYAFRIALYWQKNGKMTMPSKFSNMTSSSNFLDVVLFLLSILVTGTSFMPISSPDFGVIRIYFYKELKRNSEIGNIPVWVLPNILRQRQYTDTKFGTVAYNEM